MGPLYRGPVVLEPQADALPHLDSSREVVTVSGTGLTITAVAPGQAAVVLKMEQGGDSGYIKTVLTVSGRNPERPEPEGPTRRRSMPPLPR